MASKKKVGGWAGGAKTTRKRKSRGGGNGLRLRVRALATKCGKTETYALAQPISEYGTILCKACPELKKK